MFRRGAYRTDPLLPRGSGTSDLAVLELGADFVAGGDLGDGADDLAAGVEGDGEAAREGGFGVEWWIYKECLVGDTRRMDTIIAIIEPDADGTIHLPVPAEWRNRPVRVKASLELVETHEKPASLDLKGFGCLKGRIEYPPDFDEPLEDFKDYTA